MSNGEPSKYAKPKQHLKSAPSTYFAASYCRASINRHHSSMSMDSGFFRLTVASAGVCKTAAKGAGDDVQLASNPCLWMVESAVKCTRMPPRATNQSCMEGGAVLSANEPDNCASKVQLVSFKHRVSCKAPVHSYIFTTSYLLSTSNREKRSFTHSAPRITMLHVWSEFALYNVPGVPWWSVPDAVAYSKRAHSGSLQTASTSSAAFSGGADTMESAVAMRHSTCKRGACNCRPSWN